MSNLVIPWSPPHPVWFIMALLLSSSLLLSGRALRQHVQHVTTTGPPWVFLASAPCHGDISALPPRSTCHNHWATCFFLASASYLRSESDVSEQNLSVLLFAATMKLPWPFTAENRRDTCCSAWLEESSLEGPTHTHTDTHEKGNWRTITAGLYWTLIP